MDRQRPRRRHNERLAVVGAGRAARALAPALSAAGFPIVAVASRSVESARALAARLPSCQVATPDAIADLADVVLLTVPDAAIAVAAGQIRWRPGMAVAHCAGSIGRDALRSAAAAGAHTGVWHPLQSLATETPLLAGAAFAIDADPDLAATLTAMTEAIGGRPIAVAESARALYHLSASLVSNYAVALVAVAAELWQTFGYDRATATACLATLLAGTAHNLRAVGLPDALTGPIARGDVATVDRHLAALAANRPDLISLYRLLGEQARRIALERGLSPRLADHLAARFADGGESASPDRQMTVS